MHIPAVTFSCVIEPCLSVARVLRMLFLSFSLALSACSDDVVLFFRLPPCSVASYPGTPAAYLLAAVERPLFLAESNEEC